MFIEQLYTGCLAEAAYYVESEGEAAIIDPMREYEPYIKLANERGAKIKYIFETHFHADFVSGHLDLAKKTGASIIYGPGAKADYNIIAANDGKIFQVGKLSIEVMHTPGHTLESSCFLLRDEKGKPNAVFTGDTLFVGEVGRPDLAVKSDLSKEDLAGMLYYGIQKLKTLPNEVIVYPGHGAGSACGKNIGKETFSTIGNQKLYNYAMQTMSKEEFIGLVVDGLPEPPKYFFNTAAINKHGYDSIDEIKARNLQSLSVEEFDTELQNGAIILDTRNADIFEKGFIPGSINIGLNGQFAVWVGSLLDNNSRLLLITDAGKEEEVINRLARVGYENVAGYFEHGVESWKSAGFILDNITSLAPDKFVERYTPNQHILDVRNPSEWENGVVQGSELLTLTHLEQQCHLLDKSKTWYVYCAGGYRSMIACSLLRRKGFNYLVNIQGGLNKINAAGMPLVRQETAIKLE